MALRVVNDGDYKLLLNSGSLVDNDECCCECEATNLAEFASFLEANSYKVQFTIQSTDYSDGCSSGNCNALAGTYTLPFFSHSILGIAFRDFFTMTICGTSTTVSAQVLWQYPIPTSPIGINISGGAGLAASMVYSGTTTFTSCNPEYHLAPQNGGGSCSSSTSTGDGVDVVFVP